MVTLDASLTHKYKEASDDRHRLKADFLVNPRDLKSNKLDALGWEIAKLLKERNLDLRYGKRVHDKKAELYFT
jgi:hypothetical protein